MNAARVEQETYAGLTEIPPVAYCAHCGLASCEGCAPLATRTEMRRASVLPWASEGPSIAHFFDTARLSTTKAESVFARLRGVGPARALAFALWVELVALGSILLTVTLGLWLALPPFTAGLLRSGTTWLVASALWLLASVLVVALHVLWAELLERGIVRAGAQRDHRLALEFAGYSCGWDLLTSPVGIWLSIRSGVLQGEARTAALLAALRAPRPAMLAYLEGCRGLEPAAAQRVIARAAREALLVVGLLGLLAIGVFLGLLAAAWPY